MTLRYLLALICALLLSACGGGGSGGTGCTSIDPNRDPSLPGCGTTTPPTGKPAITLALTDSSGAAVTTIAPGGNATVTAVLKDASSRRRAQHRGHLHQHRQERRVLGRRRHRQRRRGKATLQIGPGAASSAGGYVVTAAATISGTAVSASANYSIGAKPGATASQLTFVSAAPQTIALKGTGGAGRQESSVVTFKVLDASGNPVVDQQGTSRSTPPSAASR
jgi:hypothetical protein